MSSTPASTDSESAQRVPFSNKQSHSLHLLGPSIPPMGAGADNSIEDAGATLHGDSNLGASNFLTQSHVPSGINVAQPQIVALSPPPPPYTHPASTRLNANFTQNPTTVNPRTEIGAAPQTYDTITPPNCLVNASDTAFPEPNLDTVCLPPSLANYALTSTTSPSPPLLPTIDNRTPYSPIEWQGGSLGRFEWATSHSSWDSRPVFTVASSSKMAVTSEPLSAPIMASQEPSLSPPSDPVSHASNPRWAGRSNLVADNQRFAPAQTNFIGPCWPSTAPMATSAGPRSTPPSISMGSERTGASISSSSLDPVEQLAQPYGSFRATPQATQVHSDSLQGALLLQEYPSRSYNPMLASGNDPDENLSRTTRSFDNTVQHSALSFSAGDDSQEAALSRTDVSVSDSYGCTGVASTRSRVDGKWPSHRALMFELISHNSSSAASTSSTLRTRFSSSLTVPGESFTDQLATAGVSRQMQPSIPARTHKRGMKGDQQEVKSPSARKKVHGCWMCHKSFDRPSTLKKVS